MIINIFSGITEILNLNIFQHYSTSIIAVLFHTRALSISVTINIIYQFFRIAKRAVNNFPALLKSSQAIVISVTTNKMSQIISVAKCKARSFFILKIKKLTYATNQIY